MAATIATYYSDELDDWERLLSMYSEEMAELESKLVEVIQRDNLPNIGEQVEREQEKLDAVTAKFHELGQKISRQEAALKPGSSLLDDSELKATIELEQNALRSSMQQAEKEYVDARYACYNFLSGILKRPLG